MTTGSVSINRRMEKERAEAGFSLSGGGRRNLFRPLLLWTLLLSSCASFPGGNPPLLLSQDPSRMPLFVHHPPMDSRQILYFSGHAAKRGSEETARKEAIRRAIDGVAQFLEKRGYVLTPRERNYWETRAFRQSGGVRIIDRWVRIYKASPDTPYLHRTSMYVLLAVPVPFLEMFLRDLARKDRVAARTMRDEEIRAMNALYKNEGAPFLVHLRKALRASRAIHSLRSMPERNRPTLRETADRIASRWRKSLRDLDLGISSPIRPFILTSGTGPGKALSERARLNSGKTPVGISGLSLVLTIQPRVVPEHLVFPPMTWLFGNDRPILSRSSLFWEIHLARQPPYHFHQTLRSRCTGTDSRGEGSCSIMSAWVPGNHGTLEAYYRPAPGSPLDVPFFRKLLVHTLLEQHFLFFHNRALHPLLLSLQNLPEKEEDLVIKGLVQETGNLGFVLCQPSPGPGFLRAGEREACLSGPPRHGTRALSDRPSHTLRITLAERRIETKNFPDFSITSVRIRAAEELSDRNGPLWLKTETTDGLGFTREEASASSWNALGRTLARDLDMFYFPKRESHPEEDFYDR